MTARAVPAPGHARTSFVTSTTDSFWTMTDSRASQRGNPGNYCNVKFTVTVMMTGTGTPFSSVGVYSHCRTASRAA